MRWRRAFDFPESAVHCVGVAVSCSLFQEWSGILKALLVFAGLQLTDEPIAPEKGMLDLAMAYSKLYSNEVRTLWTSQS